MLFFFSFERLTWKGHGFLQPWFSFLPMSSCNKIFSSVFLAFVGCFFFLNFGWIILFTILFWLSTVFSLSIGGGYTIWIIGIVSFFVLLILLRRAKNFF